MLLEGKKKTHWGASDAASGITAAVLPLGSNRRGKQRLAQHRANGTKRQFERILSYSHQFFGFDVYYQW